MSDVIGCVTVKPPLPNAPAGLVPAEPLRHAIAGTNEIGQPLQNIDTHGAFATHAITDRAVERLRYFLVDRHRGAAARRETLQIVETFQLRAAELERPQLRGQRTRPGLSSVGM